MIEVITKYFKNLSAGQQEQYAELGKLYPEWNEKINVISRKDIDNLYVNHILHSLAIARFIDFQSGSNILDLGTGGGFPGIPLAIMFPEVKFHLVDRIGKKIRVADDIARRIGLENVTFMHGDVGEVKGAFDFVVSRAVMDLNEMVPHVKRLISRNNFNALPNGLICLKGGDVRNEVAKYKKVALVGDVKDYFTEEYFETKKIIYVQI